MRRAIWITVACYLAAPPPAAAQVCVGDCDGTGAVSIGNLVTAVNISLGAGDINSCPAIDANGDGLVSINELIQAVSNGLNGCSPTPPASPTPEASSSPAPTTTQSPPPTTTATATPESTGAVSPQPSASPTAEVPDVSGTWDEGQLALTSSTCLEVFAVAFEEELAGRPPCTHELTGGGPVITVVDCNLQAFAGNVDAAGRITYELPEEVGAENGCFVTLATTVRVATAAMPATATYLFEISFGGTCPLDSCDLTANAVWSRRSES